MASAYSGEVAVQQPTETAATGRHVDANMAEKRNGGATAGASSHTQRRGGGAAANRNGGDGASRRCQHGGEEIGRRKETAAPQPARAATHSGEVAVQQPTETAATGRHVDANMAERK